MTTTDPRADPGSEQTAPLPRYAPPSYEYGSPPPPWSDPSRERNRGLIPGLILIMLGGAFFVGNYAPQLTGGLLFLALGAAFAAARYFTGRRGFAVPAGILLGFGAYVAIESERWLRPWFPRDGRSDGGLFFVFLGLGFLVTYLIAGRPSAIWPFYPAVILVAFGLFTAGWTLLWPVVLIALGGWLLLKDRYQGPAHWPRV